MGCPIRIPCVAISTTCARSSTSRSTSRCCTPCRARATGSPTSTSRPPDLRDHAMPQGLPRKIRYAFVTQGLLLILAVVFGVGALTLVTRDALIRQRLTVEGQAFWDRQAAGGLPATLPETRTIQGYCSSGRDRGAIPPYVESLPEGVNFIYRSRQAVLVQRRPEGTLYLVLRTHAVDGLMWTSA